MAIYTHYGTRVDFLTAQFVPVWIERVAGEIKWHYAEKKPTKRTKELREEPVWHVTGKFDDGKPLHEGKLVSLAGFVADDGINEIVAECHRLNPDHAAKFNEWNKTGAPNASHFFPTVEAERIG